jgi:site-specific DNA-methyltransferase (adenine-specific)
MLTRNSIYNGDCLDIMKLIDDESIDLICADLPYGSTRAVFDSVIDLKLLWEQYNRIIKTNVLSQRIKICI